MMFKQKDFNLRINARIAPNSRKIGNTKFYSEVFFFLACLFFNGCSTIMTAFIPKEIQDIQQHNMQAAAVFQEKNADCFFTSQQGQRTLHYVQVTRKTDGPLIIFIHGSPGEWKGWVDYLTDADLTQAATLIAVDRPGFGGSNPGSAEPSVKAQASLIGSLLDHAQPGQKVILVGHSYGGPVAARMAMDFSDKVTDLIILAGSIDPEQEHTKWYQIVADWFVFSWMIPDALRVANREIMPLKDELIAMLALWSSITQRVSVIQGDMDDLVPAENADFAEKMLTRVQKLNIIRIPQMNHFLPWKQFPLVKSEILSHLK
jgi:pimeloyl-ACP methyl ester carboxylesterase